MRDENFLRNTISKNAHTIFYSLKLIREILFAKSSNIIVIKKVIFWKEYNNNKLIG